jgi:hypothetical protein
MHGIVNAHWAFLEGGVLVIGAPNNTRGILTNACWCVATLIADFFIVCTPYNISGLNHTDPAKKPDLPDVHRMEEELLDHDPPFPALARQFRYVFAQLLGSFPHRNSA